MGNFAKQNFISETVPKRHENLKPVNWVKQLSRSASDWIRGWVKVFSTINQHHRGLGEANWKVRHSFAIVWFIDGAIFMISQRGFSSQTSQASRSVPQCRETSAVRVKRRLSPLKPAQWPTSWVHIGNAPTSLSSACTRQDEQCLGTIIQPDTRPLSSEGVGTVPLQLPAVRGEDSLSVKGKPNDGNDNVTLMWHRRDGGAESKSHRSIIVHKPFEGQNTTKTELLLLRRGRRRVTCRFEHVLTCAKVQTGINGFMSLPPRHSVVPADVAH